MDISLVGYEFSCEVVIVLLFYLLDVTCKLLLENIYLKEAKSAPLEGVILFLLVNEPFNFFR